MQMFNHEFQIPDEKIRRQSAGLIDFHPALDIRHSQFETC
jgi:hypothetical protein